MSPLSRPSLLTAFLLTVVPVVSAQAPPRAVRAYAMQGHLFVRDARGNVTQIARAAHVTEAVLSPDGRRVAYVEGHPPAPDDEADPNLLWLTDTAGGRARLLVDPRRTRQEPPPGEPGLARGGRDVVAEVENNLTGIARVQFSPDGGRVYFRTFAWQTTQAVHVVNLVTGRVHYVCPGNDLEVIGVGKNRGLLRVNQHRYHSGRGSYDQDWLVTPAGRAVRPLGPEQQE